MKGKYVLPVTLLLLLGIWLFFTPYLTANAMRTAAEEGNGAKLSGYVDFPALKESLKASFNAKLASQVAKEADSNPFSALGAAMAAALVNPMIDALVTPESLAMMMNGEKPEPGAAPADSSASRELDADIDMAYEGFDTFVVTVTKRDGGDEPVGLVLRRDSLFSWKLAAVRLTL
ncbi:MAG: DUF2939 domain-containing protein [Pseudomonadales bacterium]